MPVPTLATAAREIFLRSGIIVARLDHLDGHFVACFNSKLCGSSGAKWRRGRLQLIPSLTMFLLYFFLIKRRRLLFEPKLEVSFNCFNIFVLLGKLAYGGDLGEVWDVVSSLECFKLLSGTKLKIKLVRNELFRNYFEINSKRFQLYLLF